MSDTPLTPCTTCGAPTGRCMNCGTENPLIAKLAAALARIAELEESQKIRADCINNMNNALYMRDQRIAELKQKLATATDYCNILENEEREDQLRFLDELRMEELR